MANRNRSVDASRFTMVPQTDIPRSAFDVQHTHKTTFNSGYLIPVYVDEVLPGDSMRVRMDVFCRLATPIVPVMDNLHMDSFFFFIPNRLLWSNWERFMGEKLTTGDTTTFLTPQIEFDDTSLVAGSLADYMGITLNNNGPLGISVLSLPFRAYNLVWNDWFRDQDLQNPVVVDVDDGPDAAADYVLLRRGKRHDYFTTCRPWLQKPLGIDTVSGIAPFPYGYSPGGNMTIWNKGLGVGAPVSGLGVGSGAILEGARTVTFTGNRTVGTTNSYSTTTNEFIMDAGSAGSPAPPNIRVLVNDLRTAISIQGLLEKNSRGGTRYGELVFEHFKVRSPDARLQRPEYLGGGKTRITVNAVAQTSATGVAGTTTVLGELAGIGTAVAHNHGFSQSFTEHGVILGLVSVRADLTYQHGINRMWFRRTQFDFYWPSLAHLGEQAVFSKEIYVTGDNVGVEGDNLVFGYQERWAEYKYKPNRLSGFMRSITNPAGTLDFWHFAQHLTARPVLNYDFIVENPPVDRVLQTSTTEGHEFLFDSLFECRLVRAMPMFSIPGAGARL